eukprot:6872584-Pyramimonas_sp.AAC.1
MERRIAHGAQWCDTRDMTAGGHTRGNIERYMSSQHELKRHAPYKAGQTNSSEPLDEQSLA